MPMHWATSWLHGNKQYLGGRGAPDHMQTTILKYTGTSKWSGDPSYVFPITYSRLLCQTTDSYFSKEPAIGVCSSKKILRTWYCMTHVSAGWRRFRLECGDVRHPVHEHDDVLDAAVRLEAPRLLVVVSRHVHGLREDHVLRLQQTIKNINKHQHKSLIECRY